MRFKLSCASGFDIKTNFVDLETIEDVLMLWGFAQTKRGHLEGRNYWMNHPDLVINFKRDEAQNTDGEIIIYDSWLE